MNSQWKSFLEDRSAVVDDQGNVSFPQVIPTPTNLLCDLSHLGLIAVSGDDARTLLQGQTTNDLRDVSETQSQINSMCNPKGRMLSNFRLFQRGEVLYLQLPVSAVAATINRLKLFILRSQVSLEDASDALVRVGLAGNSAEEVLRDLAIEVPSEVDGVTHKGDLTVIRLPGLPARFELVSPAAEMMDTWRKLVKDASAVSSNQWTLLDIEAGIPTVYPETAGLFVPQMTNLQLIGGVSFTKGCYTGQEVVARMKYLGKLKRRMYRAEARSDQAPKPGDELFSASSDSGQGAGRIVEAQAIGDGIYAVLAVIEIASADKQDLTLGAGGPALRLKDLPYPFEG